MFLILKKKIFTDNLLNVNSKGLIEWFIFSTTSVKKVKVIYLVM